MSEEEIRRLKEEIEELKRLVKMRAELRRRGVYIRLDEDELAEAEPETVVSRDILRMIRENIRRSLRERGEMAVEEMVEALPEDDAASIVKSLANPERIRLIKILYRGPRSFSELKRVTGLESSSLSHHIKTLQRVGLIRPSLRLGKYVLTSRGRFLIRLLAFMYEAVGGGSVE